MMQKVGILIGRFQPFHLGHQHLVEEAFKTCDAVILLIGSAFRARSAKNPWTYDERVEMIRASMPHYPLHFAPLLDYFYDESTWINAVSQAVESRFPSESKILFGHNKDHSSYYLSRLPNWKVQECANFKEIDAKAIRIDYFLGSHLHENNKPLWNHKVPTGTKDFLFSFKKTIEYQRIMAEAKCISDYKMSWKHSPYPPIFSTTDALVLCNEHILLIHRKYPPGQDLYAMPGGFIEEKEWVETGLIRELIEETHLTLSPAELRKALTDVRVYDYPDRSQIGRVITHVGLFNIIGPFPAIKASDDALSVEWFPLQNLESIMDQFHDDHYQIIRHRLS